MRKTSDCQVHVPVMITIINNFIPEQPRFTTGRFDMSGDGYKEFLNHFLDKLLEWGDKHKKSIPKPITDFFEKAEEKMKDKNLQPGLKNWYYNRLNAIKSLMEVKVMGFNSQCYDTLALSSGLIDLSIMRYGKNSISCIKKGTGYFMLRIDTGDTVISFRDCLNYIPKQSLDKFGVSWGAEVVKLAWPYESYSSLGDIEKTLDFPPYDDFLGSIVVKKPDQKYVLELEDILQSLQNCSLKQLFEIGRIQIDLPESVMNAATVSTDLEIRNMIEKRLHTSPLKYYTSIYIYKSGLETGEFKNLLDFFVHYNRLDVIILLQAWENMSEMFFGLFKVNLIEAWSLPGVAQKILLQMYSAEVPPVFTFDNKFSFLNKELRANLVGGFSGPLTKR